MSGACWRCPKFIADVVASCRYVAIRSLIAVGKEKPTQNTKNKKNVLTA